MKNFTFRPHFSASLFGLLVIILFLPNLVKAQDVWIKLGPLASDTDNLTESESVYFNSLSELPYLSEPVVQTIIQENVGNSEGEKVVELTLPGFKGLATLIILEHSTRNLEGDIVDILTGNDIHGLIVGGGDPCIGHYFLTVDNGNINGRINTAVGDFLVRALSDSKVVVFKAESTGASVCDGCTAPQEGEGGHSHSFELNKEKEGVHLDAKGNSVPKLKSSFQSDRRCRIDFVAAVTPNAE
ncbi:MAG: hypothetical protein AB8F78_02635 [Saprospiraceae bacterium]